MARGWAGTLLLHPRPEPDGGGVGGEGSTLKVSLARPLFQIRASGFGVDQGFPGIGYYTAAHDGKRFLVAGAPEAPERQQITVFLNWTADLKR